MWPTLLFGLMLLGASAWYAAKPQRRLVPLLVSLIVVTLVSGSLGFVTGVIVTSTAVAQAGPDFFRIALEGVGESLNNVGFALVLVLIAMLPVSVGTFRIARAPAFARDAV
jgi:hypothetical protein